MTVASGLQAPAQLEQGFLKEKIRCQCGGDCKDEILGERVDPCARLAVEKQLLPQIEGIAEDADEHDWFPVKDSPDQIMRTINATVYEDRKTCIDDGRAGHCDDRVVHVAIDHQK